MKTGYSAGCSLEVTLNLGNYENLKPSFWAGITKEYDALEDHIPTEEGLYAEISAAQDVCRKICEDKIDADVFDVKNIKVFQEVLKRKGSK